MEKMFSKKKKKKKEREKNGVYVKQFPCLEWCPFNVTLLFTVPTTTFYRETM